MWEFTMWVMTSNFGPEVSPTQRRWFDRSLCLVPVSIGGWVDLCACRFVWWGLRLKRRVAACRLHAVRAKYLTRWCNWSVADNYLASTVDWLVVEVVVVVLYTVSQKRHTLLFLYFYRILSNFQNYFTSILSNSSGGGGGGDGDGDDGGGSSSSSSRNSSSCSYST